MSETMTLGHNPNRGWPQLVRLSSQERKGHLCKLSGCEDVAWAAWITRRGGMYYACRRHSGRKYAPPPDVAPVRTGQEGR